MKVLTAMYTMRKGGAYDRFKRMIHALLDRGVEVHCLSLSAAPFDHPNFHSHRIDPFHGGHERLPAKGLVLFLFPWMAFLVVWREKIDVLVAFGVSYAFLFTLAKSVFRIPMVTFVRGDLRTLFRSGRLGPVSGWIARSIGQVGLRSSDRIRPGHRIGNRKLNPEIPQPRQGHKIPGLVQFAQV